ncbi:ATP-binding cassette domain-containing protein [Nocardioides pocheonensis]|uniref:ATP-binding cassette domain-containing protein n=1 Tax=Nocardioides pocheonensis TaxID=661485 RepID=A0A3N0GI62_9ACTN|nr:ATP-binding cassette domain-containing protein [Nocardioides pocheonensis]RNM12173.1 ATP-binding cassette domain-containing protein [Nocardioides pocheonensis]
MKAVMDGTSNVVLNETDAAPYRSDETAVLLTGISKTFPGVKALDNVTFDCRPGEVHALVGENGSGKSTLIKIAAGVLTPDAGEVYIAEKPFSRGGTREARRLGLMTAYQDTSLVAELTVADNLALSFDAIGQPRPMDLSEILDRYELPFKTTDSVSALGPGARQLLEVARAMCHEPRVLLLDEPTAALDMHLAAHLEELIKQARSAGTAIVYVSHRLEEVRRIADRLSVIRDGVLQGTYTSDGWNVDDIVELMVGAPTELEFPSRQRPSSETERLVVRDLTGPGYGPISLSVRAREIVGLAGAEGNGQRALLRGLIGMGRTGGDIEVDAKRITRRNPVAATTAGISFQSGDRAAESVYLPLSVMDNLTLHAGSAGGPFGLAVFGRLRAMFRRSAKQFGIVTASPFQPISALSGGNQQKVVLARPALRQPKVLVVDEPTQGVDAKARMDIYRMLADAAEDGTAVLVNSSDSSELAGLCDRVYVMSRGKVTREIVGPTSENEIVRSFVSAAGLAEQSTAASNHPSALTRLLSRGSSQISILVLLLLCTLLAIYTGTQSPVFWTGPNLANLLLLSLPLAFVALGQQFTMLTGGLDISVGATMSLTVVLLSLTLPDVSQGSLALAIPVLILGGLAVGGFNAFLIGVLKVNPIVATIATTGIIQGIAIILRPEPGGLIAPDLGESFSWGVGFIPFPFLVLIAIAVALELWMYRSHGGLAHRAIGFDPQASNRVGRRVALICSMGLVVCAFGAVVAGVFLASLTGIGTNDVGLGYALPCFTAVFLGGAVLSGGRGSFVGAVLGAIFLSLIDNVTPLLNLPDAAKQTLYGLVLFVAVGIYAAAERVRAGRS